MGPVYSADGALLTERDDVAKRWSDHFSNLLNKASHTDTVVIENMPQRPCLTQLDDPPTREETTKAIKQLQPGKAPGLDWIPPEIYKEGVDAGKAAATNL